LNKGYEVHGLIRRSSSFNTERIDHLYHDFHTPDTRLFLHYGDLSVSGQLMDLLHSVQPDEIYHLGAQSHVRVSFDMPEYTGDVTGLGTLRILEAIHKTGIKTKFYQASSSEMFGAASPPQSEKLYFNRAVLMPPLKFMLIILCKTTVMLTAFSRLTVFFSIMNHRGAEKRSSLEKLPGPPHKSNWD